MLAITRIERTERVARKLSAIEKDRYPELFKHAITDLIGKGNSRNLCAPQD